MPAEDDNMNLHLAIVLWCQHATQPCFANDAKFWEPPSWNWKNLGKLGFTEKENCFVNNQEKPNPIQPLHKRIQFPTVKIWISSAKHKSNKLGRPLTHHPQQPRTTHACLPHPSFEPCALPHVPYDLTKLSTANIPVGWNSLIRVQTNARSNAFNKSKRRIHTRVPAASVLFNIFLAVACCLHWLFCVTQLLKACK